MSASNRKCFARGVGDASREGVARVVLGPGEIVKLVCRPDLVVAGGGRDRGHGRGRTPTPPKLLSPEAPP